MQKKAIGLLLVLVLVFSLISVAGAAESPIVYFFEDFEEDSGSFVPGGSWNWGSPTIWTGAYSGSNCWGTNLSGNYPDYANDYLITPVIDLTDIPDTATFPIYVYWFQRHIIESGFDSVSVFYRIDGGSWESLWSSSGAGGYDWTLMSFDISAAKGHELEIAWRLYSDFIITNYGYYIDNVMVATDLITPTASIAVTPESLELDVGETGQLDADVSPSDATYPDPIWSSSDESVATVDSDGLVTAVGPGTAMIRATTSDTGLWDYCDVTVNAIPIPLTEIIVLPETASMVYPGDDLTLNASLVPENPDDPTILWRSSDDSIATVVDGVVTAHGIGSVTIEAYSPTYSSVSDACAITINAAPIPVEGITLNITTLGLIDGGEPVAIEALFTPSNATNQNIIWSSSDEDVAVVVKNGGMYEVHAVGEGTCEITATTEDGGFTAVCAVTVSLAEIPDTGIGSTSPSALSMILLSAGMLIGAVNRKRLK